MVSSARSGERGRTVLPDEFSESVAELVARAERTLWELSESDGGDPEKDLLDELVDVASEANELLASVNVEKLLEAVDVEAIPEVIDWENLPEAVVRGDYRDAIDYGHLRKAVELRELWNAVNVREFWRAKRELDEEWEDVVESLSLTDGTSADEGGTESSATSAGASDAFGSEMGESDEVKQVAVQMKVSDAVGVAREALLDAHEELRETVESTQARSRSVGRASSNNPTAVSTLPRSRGGVGGGTRYSTVPSNTRYSSAPNRDRIYGARFEKAKRRTNR